MKKFVVLALAVILIGVAVPGAQAEYWNEGNYGYSEETAYVIDSISDFVEFQNRVNNGTEAEGSYYKLGINLNLAGNYPKWIPIGTESSPFKGHFNGNGKTITMYTEKYPETLTTRDIEYNSSLFGSIETDNDYAVKDLTVKGTIQGSFLAARIVLSPVQRLNRELHIYRNTQQQGIQRCEQREFLSHCGFSRGNCGLRSGRHDQELYSQIFRDNNTTVFQRPMVNISRRRECGRNCGRIERGSC